MGAMRSYVFRVVIEEDLKEDGTMAYMAYCPALRGCTTWGYTYEEALENIREAIQAHIESLLKDGEPIPTGPGDEVRVLDGPAVSIVV